jgi:hypothetical protein
VDETLLAAIIAAIAALIAGGLAYRAGQIQAKATRDAADAQVKAADDSADAQVRAVRDAADAQLAEMRSAGHTANKRRTFAAAWTLRSEASRLSIAAEQRRRLIEPHVGKSATSDFDRSALQFSVSENVRNGRPGIELLDQNDQYLIAELVRAVDECSSFIETIQSSGARMRAFQEHLALLLKVETFAARLAAKMLEVMEANR